MPPAGTREALSKAFAAVLLPDGVCLRALDRAADKPVSGDDLAAIFTLLAAAAAYDQSLIDETIFAKVAHALVTAEQTVGGPYRSLAATGEMICEPIANAAIARFLACFGQKLPKVELFLAGQSVAQRRPAQDVALLVTTQLPSGWWAGMAGRSSLVVTAEAVAALAASAEWAVTLPSARPVRIRQDKQALLRDVFALARQQLDSLEPSMRRAVMHMMNRVRKADHNHEIALIGYLFAGSLRQKSRASRDVFVRLGAANMYNWMAYTIYDDFLDDEGDPAMLSVANIALRMAVRGFKQALPRSSVYQRFVDTTFDTVDCANAWELAHCRFLVVRERITIGALPRFGALDRLGERSLTHALPVVGVLAAQGFSPDSPVGTAVRSALKHYLIARQLNDDLRDWESDVRAGHISYTVQVLLHELRCKPAVRDLRRLLPRMRQQFWHTLEMRCAEIMTHTAAARAALAQTHLVLPGGLDMLCDDIDDSLRRTQTEYAKTIGFLHAYRNRPKAPSNDNKVIL